MTLTRLIFLGPPGAGKGTQAKFIAQLQNIPHISTGEMLRQAIEEKTALGIQAQDYLDQGELVPNELVQEMVKERLNKPDAQTGWILDGFPRTIPQATFLEELLLEISQGKEQAINLDVPDEVLITRLLARGRKDDSREVISRRLEVYRAETAPLIDYYSDRQKLIVVDGNQPEASVTAALNQIIAPNHS